MHTMPVRMLNAVNSATPCEQNHPGRRRDWGGFKWLKWAWMPSETRDVAAFRCNQAVRISIRRQKTIWGPQKMAEWVKYPIPPLLLLHASTETDCHLRQCVVLLEDTTLIMTSP